MKIYNYNKLTKEFISESFAVESPLEKGKYIIPANSTTKSPLSPKEDSAVCFNESSGEWEYVSDYRGKEYVTNLSPLGEIGTIRDLGEIDESYYLVENLKRDKDGNLYKYYLDDGTPDLVKEQEEKDEQHNNEILAQITQKEQKLIRPMRELLSNTATTEAKEYAQTKVDEIETEIQDLRSQLIK